jgi:hypothetical protein
MTNRYSRALYECADCADVWEVPTDVRHEVEGCPYCLGDNITHVGPFDG